MNIKQAAAKFDLTTDTLRYYERVGVIPAVHRNTSGYRDYTTSDLNWIYLAKRLRAAGMSVESLIDFAELAKGERTPAKQAAQKEILNEQLELLTAKLAEMNQVRALLEFKIETYDDHIARFVNGDEMVEAIWEHQFEN